MAVKNLDHGFIFATPHPALDDFLPLDHDAIHIDDANSGVFQVGVKDAIEPGMIHFPDVDAYPSIVQSCYLLGRVMNYMKSNTVSLQAQEKEFVLLVTMTQTFGQSLLRQAEGSSLRGHYCTPFFLSIV